MPSILEVASASASFPVSAVVVSVMAFASTGPARGDDFKVLDTRGLPRSQGMVVRITHPEQWRRVPLDDDMAVAELRGPQGRLTGILQIGRGRQRSDMGALCRPERAQTMLRNMAGHDPETRVTDVVARTHEGRTAYEIRYERTDPPNFIRAHSMIVCLKDSQLIVSCAGAGAVKDALATIEPVCSRVMESMTITED